jgi:hypothetical protein
MLVELTEPVKETIRSAAQKLTGFRRRQFQAEVAIKYCQGHPRRAEEVFGWGRDAVNTGLNELRTGIRCVDNFSAVADMTRARPELVAEIRTLVEPSEQTDRNSNAARLYADNSKAVLQAVSGQPGGKKHHCQ